MLQIGIDDAGRGPLIGPMILAGVFVTKEQEAKLKSLKIRDSKIVSQKERVKLAELIKSNSSNYKIVKTSATEIDDSLSSGTNLNTLEAKKTAQIINALNNKKEKITVVVDCPSVNTESWKKTLENFIEHKDNLVIKCEHKADANHVSVSAGSILAKTTREEEVAKIRKEFGEIGSGYPSDPNTIKFLKEHGKNLANAGIFRKTWSTWRALFPQEAVIPKTNKEQKSLGEF